MAAKPPVVPFLLRQLDQAACCPGVVAAALGELSFITCMSQYVLSVCKLMWQHGTAWFGT